MENYCTQPLLILRQNNKNFKQKQKVLHKRIKSKRFLRQQIYSNHKIFQSGIDFYRNMTAQNIICDKNYNFKCTINKIKQENSGLKARIWNIQKENRKMQRQKQSWNLNEEVCINLIKKPYIDMSTFEKVISDQDYNIVSMKILICQLQKQYQKQQTLLETINKKNKNLPKLLSLFNHEIATRKIQICQLVKQDDGSPRPFQGRTKEKMSSLIVNQNQKLDLIEKNMQIKKKSKLNIENDLIQLRQECELVKNVTFQEIQRLNDEIRWMRTQEMGGIHSEKEKVKKIKKEILDFQYHMQISSDQYVKQKIEISLEIQRIEQALLLLSCENNHSSAEHNEKGHSQAQKIKKNDRNKGKTEGNDLSFENK